MASDPFDFSDVLAEIEKGIDDFMKNEDTHEVASRMFADSTIELVYKQYEPTVYDGPGYPISRRYDEGGLQDWRNYHVLNIGKMNMTVINETMGNWVWAPMTPFTGRVVSPYPSEGWDAGYINDIIESGQGYHWTRSEIYKNRIARPFMEEACNRFVDNYLLPTIHSIFFDD